MKKFILGALSAGVLALVTIGLVLQSGFFSFAADEPHADQVAAFIGRVRERSIARAAQGIVVPADLTSAERVRRGAGNYDAMCVECHLAPGRGATELHKGLYPVPPDLTTGKTPVPAGQDNDARRFWIIKHGIKGSAMAAWGKSGVDDPAIWDLVAFVGALPSLTEAAYRQQVRSSAGHVHSGVTVEHDHAAHSHKH